MAELTIGYTIKVILGLLVIVAVVWGIYMIFKNNILDFFKGLSGGNLTDTTKIILAILN